MPMNVGSKSGSGAALHGVGRVLPASRGKLGNAVFRALACGQTCEDGQAPLRRGKPLFGDPPHGWSTGPLFAGLAKGHGTGGSGPYTFPAIAIVQLQNTCHPTGCNSLTIKGDRALRRR